MWADPQVFSWWVFLGLLHSGVLFGLPYGAMTHDVAWGNGRTGGYLVPGNMVYTYVVITVCLKVTSLDASICYVARVMFKFFFS